jgi:choline dehydrogenase-like flavoprotein
MAATSVVVLSEIQRDVLRLLADTVIPPVEREDDPTGFWARSASDLQLPAVMEQALAGASETDLAGLRGLLDALHGMGFAPALPQATREAMLLGLMDADPGALAGLSTLKGLALMLFYALPDAAGRNPNWDAIGYPGPRSAPPTPDQAPKTIAITRPQSADLVLSADVVVVGSGAGGGTIAGTLAQAGKDVVILEAGGYYNEADFNQLELWAYEHLYRGGGVTSTANGQVALMAGSNLGGGTTVNWTNCLRTTPWVREQWEREFGLEGLAGPEFDRHLDAVFARIGVNADCSDFNGPTKRMQEGCEKLGYGFQVITRNADPAPYDADLAGLLGFGDQTGSKQGTMKTFLQDASDAGARTVVNCRVTRVLVDDGKAHGVEGTYTGPDGRVARVVVYAPQVVLAASALDTPALLLRSGIGGPAAGDYLRLHPATVVLGMYGEQQQGWWGAPQTALSAEFARLEGDYGFLVETSHASPGISAPAVGWQSGEQHKTDMARSSSASALVFLIRDRGHGRVTIDAAGNPVHEYALTDPVDQRTFRRGLQELVRLHGAAGAEEILSVHRKPLRWRRDAGDDVEAFARQVADGPIDPFEQAIFALHQMGSARMGNDRTTSVADPWGELHDTTGVWIGDASAFPTASGTNPMATTMALAHRTAEAIQAAS